ncbi:MAG: hypothetical protein HYU71_01745 [Bacteroidetes bacterium]|nr:hypothetical protein [Bacteroidota bacterium]
MMERLQKFSELDVNYTEMQETLKGFSELAAKVSVTPISLINLIDAFTLQGERTVDMGQG